MTTVPATIQEQIALPAPASAQGGSGLNVSDIAAILKHRLVMIVLLWWLFTALGVGLFFLVYFKFPTYPAEALIECISDLPTQPGEFELRGMTEDRHERFVASHAMFAVSPQVLNTVLQSPEVRGTSWYRQADQTKLRLELEDDIGAGAVRGTNYFRIVMGCRDPKDPARIINQVVATYMEKIRNEKTEAYRDELEAYQKEQNSLESRITQKLKQIQDFVTRLEPGVVSNPNQHGPTVVDIMERQKQVAMLELQTLELASYVQIYTDPQRGAVTVEDSQEVERDPRIVSLDNQVNILEQELELRQRSFGSEHREVKDIRRRVDAARRQLGQVRGNKLREIIDFKLERALESHANSQHSLLLAMEKLKEARARQADQERKLAEYAKLQDELGMLRQAKERLDEYVREVERVVREQNAVKIAVAQYAVEPIERSSPSLLLLPACVVVALGLAVGIAVGLEVLDTSVRTPQDIVRHLSLPLLGTVPDVDDEEVDIERIEDAVRTAPHSMVAEAFRTIRTNLQFSAPAERQRSLVITSPRPEDGKTAVACNLAASIALTGRRVLLVDANLRRPALHRVYPPQEGAQEHRDGGTKTGLSNFLIGAIEFDSLVYKTDTANVDVVTSGPTPPNPAELLSGSLAREFIERGLSRYDQVIIDAPPVLLASDVTVLASQVDGVVLVCRARDNSRGQAQRALSLLDRVNATVLGGILNCAQVRRGGYFREQLRTFYEYQEEEEPDIRERALPSGASKEIGATGDEDDDRADAKA